MAHEVRTLGASQLRAFRGGRSRATRRARARSVTSSAPINPGVYRAVSGHDLAGQLEYEWTDGASGTAQLEIHLDHAQRCLTAGGLTLGTAELSVRAVGVTAHFSVNVAL